MIRYLILFGTMLFLTTNDVQAQCNQFYQFQEGQSLTYTTFNKKGKPINKEIQNVIMYEPTTDGFLLQLEVTYFDKKGEETFNNLLDARCENGVYTFDVRNFLNDDMLQSFKDMEMTVEGKPLEIPNKLEVGQELPSGDCTISADAGVMKLNLSLNIEDRKVTGRETITTEAGTFDCYVIEQTMTSKMIVKTEFKTKEFVTEKYGPVRIENYNKKGKLVTTRDLTNFKI